MEQKLSDKKLEEKEVSKKNWIQQNSRFILKFINTVFKLKNFKKMLIVHNQKIIGNPDIDINNIKFLKLIVGLIIILGIYYKIKTKKLFTSLDIFGIISIPILNAGHPDNIVLSRYFIILIPLLYLYFFYLILLVIFF